jgi:DNA-binding CsgD family transcriptional regulator
MLTRREREQNVLDLYNQGKTIRDIAREIRMSFRDIGAVLKKEEEKERRKRQLENTITSSGRDNNQRDTFSSTQAYELFSQGKTPVEVAIELDLNEKQVTKYYKEYWKLNGLYKLNQVHEEIKDDISNFLKLYRSSKAAGMSTDHVMKLLEIANNDLPALEDKYEKLEQNVTHLESSELDAGITLEDLKSQMRNANQTLHSFNLSCQNEVRKMFQLRRQNMRLDSLLRQFKNSNKGYLKIRYTAKQAVRSALSDSRQLLKFAILSLTESLRADPIKFNFLFHGMPQPLTMSKSTLIDYAGSSNHQTDPFSYYSNQNSYTETLTEVIVNEAAILYEKMVKEFTDETMNNAATGNSSNVLPSMVYLDEQTDHTQALAYRHITQTSVYD